MRLALAGLVRSISIVMGGRKQETSFEKDGTVQVFDPTSLISPWPHSRKHFYPQITTDYHRLQKLAGRTAYTKDRLILNLW